MLGGLTAQIHACQAWPLPACCDITVGRRQLPGHTQICNEHDSAVWRVRQARLEDEADSKTDSKLTPREECMYDLQGAAVVLEAAVTTVAAAAERRPPRQPSDRLLTVCCKAVGALMGACALWLSQKVSRHSMHIVQTL